MELDLDMKYIKEVPTPTQLAFFSLDKLDVLFGGGASGGKSSALLMSALKYVNEPEYDAIIMRDTYANLTKPGALMERSFEWLSGTDAHWNGDAKRWEFPSGATLSFGYLDSPRDHYSFQSSEYQFVGIDECVNIREHQALYMFSRLRKRITSKVPIRFRCASNPPTREQLARGAWVKRRYIDPNTRHPGAIFVPSLMRDNPHVNQEEYVKSLMNLDPITRRQLLDGDWDVKLQGDFFKREWFKIVDKLPPESEIDLRVRFWDMAATQEKAAGKQPARTSGCRMYRTIHGQWYIDSIVKFRKTPLDTEQIIRQTADMDGRYFPIRMEWEGGSGGAITIDHYTRYILSGFDFRGRKPPGSKAERASPFASQAEAGNVFLVAGPWVADFLDEAEMFPDGEYKDRIDSTSGAFNVLTPGSAGMPEISII
jgi:predicted phage terminase large subunit-like protein